MAGETQSPNQVHMEGHVQNGDLGTAEAIVFAQIYELDAIQQEKAKVEARLSVEEEKLAAMWRTLPPEARRSIAETLHMEGREDMELPLALALLPEPDRIDP